LILQSLDSVGVLLTTGFFDCSVMVAVSEVLFFLSFCDLCGSLFF
jgi:hypothetical protein